MQADNLQKVNVLLEDKKKEIQVQADNLEDNNRILEKLNATKDNYFDYRARFEKSFQRNTQLLGMLTEEIEKLSLPEIIAEKVNLIYHSSREAYSLLNNLLDWARTQTGNVALDPSVFDLNEVIRQNTEILRLNAQIKNISLTISGTQVIYVCADKNMISTVLRNLISNAIKFTEEGGKVEITTESGIGYVEVSISDSGIGINQDTLSQLFKVDHLASTFGTAGEKGTGLGLLICKEFIELNKGSIKAESESDKGSKFTVILPVNKEAQSTAEKSGKIKTKVSEKSEIINLKPEAPLTEKDLHKIILVVEDDPNIRTEIKQVLSSWYTVKTARNGKEGLKKAIEMIPDVVISDVLMPEMDGFELCRAIKTNEVCSHIPVILLTAQSALSSRIEGINLGADDYITKPFSNELLLARVNNLIKSRNELKQKYSHEFILKPQDIFISGEDNSFIEKVLKIIENHISDFDFSIDTLSNELNISRMQLYRKLEGILNQTPGEILK